MIILLMRINDSSIERNFLSIASDFGIPLADITVRVREKEDLCGFVIDQNGAKDYEIAYGEPVFVYRALFLLATGEARVFPFSASCCTDHSGIMIDASRNAVMRPDRLMHLVRLHALLGLNMLMLYIEDTYTVREHGWFGYLRGRYTPDEIRQLDDYAASFGISLVPCIQTLAHLHTALRYPEASGLCDTEDILLADCQEVYDFLKDAIRSISSTFSSRIIHIGMDEAHMLGLGRYLRLHGYQNRFGIMKRHLERVCGICRHEGLSPIIWSDMFFRLASVSGDYYNVPQDYEWKQENMPPADIGLVYWDYYNTDEAVYDRMVKLHEKLAKKEDIWFAGGGWTWNGIAPNYSLALKSTGCALINMKKHGVRNWFFTLWGDNGSETPSDAGLYPFLLFAEHVWNERVSASSLSIRFKSVFHTDDSFIMLLDEFDSINPEDESNTRASNPSKWLLYQDVLLGLFDENARGHGWGRHYENLASRLEKAQMPESFSLLRQYYVTLARLLSIKAELGIRSRDAYLRAEKDEIRLIVNKDIPECISNAHALRNLRKSLFFHDCKPQGFEVLDIRLGGLITRLESARERLLSWLEGNVTIIEELEEERRAYDPASDYIQLNLWEKIVTPSDMCGV